jgi:CheY-like chemotaxis protein
MKKYKVGLVGVRRGSSYLSVFANNPRTEIAAVCDLKHEPLVEIAKQYHLNDNRLFTDYYDFVNADIDIVVLGTPIPFHAEQTVAALENGKHVLSEVTASDTIEGCEAIFKAASRSKYKYMLAENCIYMHFCRQWKKWVDDGKTAYDKILELKPDIALVAIIMPVLDGLAIMEKCFTDPALTTKFIVLSSINDPLIAKESFKIGASYYMLKPIDLEVLAKRIRLISRCETNENRPVPSAIAEKESMNMHRFHTLQRQPPYLPLQFFWQEFWQEHKHS